MTIELGPLGHLVPGHVLDGHGEAVRDPHPGVDRPEAALAEHLAHPVDLLHALDSVPGLPPLPHVHTARYVVHVAMSLLSDRFLSTERETCGHGRGSCKLSCHRRSNSAQDYSVPGASGL